MELKISLSNLRTSLENIDANLEPFKTELLSYQTEIESYQSYVPYIPDMQEIKNQLKISFIMIILICIMNLQFIKI